MSKEKKAAAAAAAAAEAKAKAEAENANNATVVTNGAPQLVCISSHF